MSDEVQEFSNALAYEYIKIINEETKTILSSKMSEEVINTKNSVGLILNEAATFLPIKDRQCLSQIFIGARLKLLSQSHIEDIKRTAVELDKIEVIIANDFVKRCESEIDEDYGNLYSIFQDVLAKRIITYQSEYQAWANWGLEQIEWGKKQVEASVPMLTFARDSLHGFFSNSYQRTVAIAEQGVTKAFDVMDNIDNVFRCGQAPMIEEENDIEDNDSTQKLVV